MLEVMEPDMAKRTTLRMGGRAIAELIIENMPEFGKLGERVSELGGKAFIIGKGSNILAADGELPYVLIRPKLKPKLEIWTRQGNKYLVRASSSISIGKLLQFCLKHGLTGLEGLVGIPGTVGGATAMNAGSFGCEIGKFIHSVLVWGEAGLKILKKDDISFSYRKTIFSGIGDNGIVIESIFALTESSKGAILEQMNLNYFQKKSRQPLNYPSAGCTFKNPPGDSAGRLLEAAGFKGKSNGNVAFSGKHANFLINKGKGTASSALELINDAQNTVADKFGINLELEVRIIS